jgi:outer membrane receptor protein involved in Fe transport
VDTLGESDAEQARPKWRNVTAATFIPRERQSATVSALTTAGYKKQVPEMGRINHYTTVDVNYSIATRTSGEFSLGVKNVLGTTPPLDDSAPTHPLQDSLYDQIGRQFIVGYKAKF